MSYEPPDSSVAHDVPPFPPAAVTPPIVQYSRTRPRFRDKRWKHVVLFLATLLTTTLVGWSYYGSFLSQIGQRPIALHSSLLLGGLWYSIPALLILLAHEMGHYLACRHYDIDASLPFFLPFPSLPTGTLGAVIRIREPFPTLKALFDVGIAGPIGGFLMLVPILFWGLSWSELVPLRELQDGVQFGEPLLLRGAERLIFGVIPANLTLNAHPLVMAAWLGMLVTALNLLPFGQLDGGHVTHATFQKRSTLISIVTVVVVAGMCLVSTSWIATTVVMLLMLIFIGPSHPRVLDDESLDRGRLALAFCALLMLILCITPIPVTVIGP